MEKIRLLSLVVPTYKQQESIVKNIKSLEEILKSIQIPFEIIVVVDGQVDKTYERVSKIKNAHIRVLGYKENYGKGHAVRYGMLKAKGDIIGFIDAGMDIDPTGISMLLNHMIWYDADIIVGSKLHPVSQVNYPFFRKLLSWGYRSYTRILFGLKVKDTQVGIKFYKRNVVEDVFPKLLVKQFAFDIETLAVAYALGYKRIFEAPIRLTFNNVSTITDKKYRKVVWNMLWDTSAVFYRIKIRRYYQKLQ